MLLFSHLCLIKNKVFFSLENSFRCKANFTRVSVQIGQSLLLQHMTLQILKVNILYNMYIWPTTPARGAVLAAVSVLVRPNKNKFISMKPNSNFNHFQQLLFHTFPCLLINIIFLIIGGRRGPSNIQCKQHWLNISFCRKMEHTRYIHSNNRKYLCFQTVISL